jgi:predicted ATPase
MEVSGLEDEYRSWGQGPCLIYVREPSSGREPRLAGLLDEIGRSRPLRSFASLAQLEDQLSRDLAEFHPQALPTEKTEAGPSRLPQPLTSLIGREDETVAVMDLIAGEVRLVTLHGPGGVGKTRIALEVGRRIEGQFAGGVHLIGLSSLNDPSLLPNALAQIFGLMEAGNRFLLEVLIEHLSEQRLLLILDGFETMLGAAPLVAELLARVAGLKLLVTSRTLLRIAGEYPFAVQPLKLPTEEQEQSEAVQLFVERARAVQPGFTLNAQNAQAIAEICRRLDGLPLAIELAAVRVALLAPAQLLERLKSRLGTLTEGPRDLPERQRTLRNTLDWSYRLLSPGEQTLFMRMGVLMGASLEALEVICGQGQPDLLSALSGLIEKSLLEHQAGEQPRFVMLETLREYALEKLEASAQVAALRNRHAEYFLELSEAAHSARFGPAQSAWTQRLEAEQGNLRSALAWCIEQTQAEAVLKLTSALRWFWDQRGRYSEGRRWLEAALHLEAPPALAQPRSDALHGAGVLAWRQGEYSTARKLLEEGLALRRTTPDPERTAESLQGLGNLATHLGQFAAARAYQEESLALRQTLAQPHGIADAQFSLGNVALVEGRLAEAKALYRQCLALYEQVGDRASLPFVWVNLAEVARFEGDYRAAESWATQARQLAEELGDRLRLANAQQSLGLIARDQGHWAEAQPLLEHSLRIYRELGHGLKIGFVTCELGTVHLYRGNLAEAQTLFEQGLETHTRLGLEPGLAYARLGLARAALAGHNAVLALGHLRQGLPSASRSTDHLTQAHYLEAYTAALAQDQPELAARLLGLAQQLRQTGQLPPSPAERGSLEATQAQLETRLGQRWPTLLTEGHTLSLEQAMALVP